MGEVTIDLAAELAADNPKKSAVELRLYADALRVYLEAADNVRRLGNVVSHPRTGSPMDNPCLKIMERQGAILAKMRVRADRVLRLAEQQMAE